MKVPPCQIGVDAVDPEIRDGVMKAFDQVNGHMAEVSGAFDKGISIGDNVLGQFRDINIWVPDYGWYTVGATGNAAFKNSWVAFSSTTATPKYAIYPCGHVLLQGMVKTGTVGLGTPIFTLPAGFRPAEDHEFAVPSNGAYGQVTVTSAGDVSLSVGSNVKANISGIKFQAAKPCAAPAIFSGNYNGTQWPQLISHSLADKVTSVSIVGGSLVGGGVADAIGAAAIDFEQGTGKQIRIRSIYGLQPGKQYNLRLLLLTR